MKPTWMVVQDSLAEAQSKPKKPERLTLLELEQRLRNSELSVHADALLAIARPSVHLTPTRCELDELPFGASRLGGVPDVPADFVWPTYRGKPHAFLAQFDLASLPNVSDDLPRAGSLAVFYETESMQWGFDPEDRGCSLVAYFDDAERLHRTLGPGRESPCHAIRSEAGVDLPHFFDVSIADLWERMSQEERDEYFAITCGDSDDAPHHLLGHPQLVQGDMHLEAQLASNGVYCGEPGSYESVRARELANGAGEWELLLQLCSDEQSLEWMWGDVGRLYFWLRRDDLRARRFEKSWLILQCG